MQTLAWGGRHLFHWPWLQRRIARASSACHHATIQRFTAESPVPTQRAPYTALQIFWGYNFFRRRSKIWHLNIPALIISGGQDPMFNEAMGADLARRFPDGKHLHLENAGHLIMAEYPDQINQALTNA